MRGGKAYDPRQILPLYRALITCSHSDYFSLMIPPQRQEDCESAKMQCHSGDLPFAYSCIKIKLEPVFTHPQSSMGY